MDKGFMKIKMKVEGIRDPKTNALLEKNGDYVVTESQFWLKRIKDGDVERLLPSMKKAEKQVKKKAKKKTKKQSKPLADKPESEQDLDQKMGDE